MVFTNAKQKQPVAVKKCAAKYVSRINALTECDW